LPLFFFLKKILLTKKKKKQKQKTKFGVQKWLDSQRGDYSHPELFLKFFIKNKKLLAI
jgi:hypothetical protein